jgi:hypothetical protein
MQQDEIVCLVTADTPVQAHVWREALEAEGVRCQVVGDYLDAGVGDVPGIRAEVWVHREDVDRAKAVLAAHQGANEVEEEEEA